MVNKEEQVMQFLHSRVFDPILSSDRASTHLKKGVRYTIMRLEQRDAVGMVGYFWSAIAGTDRSSRFAQMIADEGFVRFEDIAEEFSRRFDDAWLAS